MEINEDKVKEFDGVVEQYFGELPPLDALAQENPSKFARVSRAMNRLGVILSAYHDKDDWAKANQGNPAMLTKRQKREVEGLIAELRQYPYREIQGIALAAMLLVKRSGVARSIHKMVRKQKQSGKGDKI